MISSDSRESLPTRNPDRYKRLDDNPFAKAAGYQSDKFDRWQNLRSKLFSAFVILLLFGFQLSFSVAMVDDSWFSQVIRTSACIVANAICFLAIVMIAGKMIKESKSEE